MLQVLAEREHHVPSRIMLTAFSINQRLDLDVEWIDLTDSNAGTDRAAGIEILLQRKF